MSAANQTASQGGVVARRPLVAYFVLAFVIAWLIWGLSIAATQGWVDINISPDVWLGLGAIGPLGAAFIVTSVIGGAEGIRELVGRIFRWRVKLVWFLMALLGPAILFALAAAIVRLSGGAWPDFSQKAAFPELGLGVTWLIFLLFALGEEPGWRGFALPRMQARRSALVATLILSVIWGLWHLPIFFVHPGFGEFVTSMGPFGIVFWFVLSLLPQAILYTWLYNSSGGSILMPTLWHAGLNTFSLRGGQDVAGLMGLLHVLLAIIVIIVARPANLSRPGKHTLAT